MRRTLVLILAAVATAGCGGDDDEPAANAESAGASGAETSWPAPPTTSPSASHRRAAAGQAGHPAGLRRRQRGGKGVKVDSGFVLLVTAEAIDAGQEEPLADLVEEQCG